MVAEEINLLEVQLRESFGKVVYSHKTHEKCSDILLGRLSNIKLAQIILSAIATGSFISVVFVDETVSALVGAVFSTVLLVLNTYTKDYDLGELAQKHKQSANVLWSIRESYFSLLTDIRAGYINPDDARSIRDELNQELSVVYESSPPTFSKAYEAARKALKENEELTFSDEELDSFLPVQLRVK